MRLIHYLVLSLATLCASAQHHGTAHWGYDGPEGPDHWGETAASCQIGQVQSPIDIQGAVAAKLPPIQFHYRPSALHIIDNGHTIQVNLEKGSTMTVNHVTYRLLQFHFHRPSEERINGKAFDMVIHLVHASAAKKLAVVAVLLEANSNHDVLNEVFSHIPKVKEHEEVAAAVKINPADLLPSDHNYFTFEGSLTTPPCSEGVSWFVLKNPAPITQEHVNAFRTVYDHNARPVQPLHGRKILASE